MRVSGGESVCPPPDPAQTQRAERWEVPYTVGGWMGVEDAVYPKAILCLEKRGPICLLVPDSASAAPTAGHPTQDIHWAALHASPGCSRLGSALSGAEVGIGEAPDWVRTGPVLISGASWVSGGSEN